MDGSSAALAATVLLTSLGGSLHCAGMCGGFTGFCAGSGSSQVAYHLGRLTTYTLLGIVSGALGRALDLVGAAVGVPRTAAALAGMLMVLWGVNRLAETYGYQLWSAPVPAALRRALLAVHGQVRARPAIVRGWLLGLSTTLLPCGWLYAFVVTAAGTGSPLHGALVMAMFWLGTVPILVGLGSLVGLLGGRARAALPRVTAIALIAVGLFAMSTRGAAAFAVRPPPDDPGAPAAPPHACH
jgi:sulfite exporter TauE/SafE